MRNQLARLVSLARPHIGAICAIVLIALASAYVFARTRHHEPDTIPVRQALAQEFAKRSIAVSGDLESLRGENGRLKKLLAIAEGKTERKPDTIIMYDTIIHPDTVTLFVTVDGSGRADVTRGVKDSTGFRPETAKHIDVHDCDDGMSIVAGGVTCNRAVLGHLSMIARAGVSREVANPLLRYDFAAGVHWQHTFRSTSGADVMIDARRRLSAAVTLGVRVF